MAGAAMLGLALGFSVVLRGQSLASNAAPSAGGRPTFVIGAAASPVPRGSPSPVGTEPAPLSVGSATTSDYVVQPGDTLRSIAENVYGDADQWPRIYDANRDLIGPDPDALQAGMRLRIP